MLYNKKHDFNSDRFLRLRQVLNLIPVSKSTWWKGVKTGRFPKASKLGPRTTVWRESEISALIRDAKILKKGGT